MRAIRHTTQNAWAMALAMGMALGGAAVGQEIHPTLAKAKVMVEAEHDYDGAAQLYRQLAEDESIGPELRAEAFLGLADIHARRGELTNARQALQNAANGTGPAAEEAKRQLQAPQDPQSGDGSVDMEVLRLLTVVLAEQGSNRADDALASIAWFGERAVPLLAEAARREKDYGFATDCARGLLMIGGPKVEAWIGEAVKYEDALRRRAVARAADVQAAQVDRSKLAAFLEDPNPEVRLQAVESGILLDWEQAIARVRDEDPRVRKAAFGWLTPGSSELRQGVLPDPSRQREVIAGLIDAAVDHVSEVGDPRDPRGVISKLVRGIRRVAEPLDQLVLALHLCRATELPLVEGLAILEDLRSALSAPGGESNVLVEETLATARTLRERGVDSGRSTLFYTALLQVVRTWDRASLDAALELLALDFGFDVQWLRQHTEPTDWVRIFERLEVFDRLDGYLDGHDEASYLGQQLEHTIDLDLPDQAFPPLRTWFEAKAAAGPVNEKLLELALVRLGKFDSEESLRWTVRMLSGGLDELLGTSQPKDAREKLRQSLFQGLITDDGDASRSVLRELAVVEGEDLGDLRSMALARLAWLHDVESAPLFAEAYRLGLDRAPMIFARGAMHSGQYNMIGLEWIEHEYTYGTPDGTSSTEPWTDAEKARAIGPCLELGTLPPWIDARRMIWQAKAGTAVFEVALRNWSKCPNEIDRRLDSIPARENLFPSLLNGFSARPTDPLLGNLALEALGDASPVIREKALGVIRTGILPWGDDLERAVLAGLESEDLGIVSGAIAVLGGSGDPGVEEHLVGFLDDSYQKSREAVRALFQLVPERAIELTLPTLRRPEHGSTMCHYAKSTLDQRFVPLLLNALRSEASTTREEAREALDAIEYYISQEARWKRLLGEAGLESTSAAEALLKQARQSKDNRIRITAIQSLGTLAVPETLPFLIQLMQDEDPAIAVAATKAVERINRAK